MVKTIYNRYKKIAINREILFDMTISYNHSNKVLRYTIQD